MGETNDLQRMRGLIDKLNEASRRYYDQNESDISDDEWDAMYAELRKLEEKTGERMADSPTRRVGGAVMRKADDRGGRPAEEQLLRRIQTRRLDGQPDL